MSEQATPLQPNIPANRIALLDIFRGFALFGIFIVNIRFMTSSVLHPMEFTFMTEGSANKFMEWVLEIFFNGKFFPIFSFLFGVGFGMQINKMEEKGTFSAFFFMKRYFFLMLFGIFQIVILWGGDVLVLYAIAGFTILLIRKIPVKSILILAALILMFPYYGHILNKISTVFESLGTEPLRDLKDYSYSDIVAINTQGSFIEALKFRLYEYTVYYRNVEYFPTLIFMIFGGYAAGRYKFYKKIPQTLSKLNLVAIVALIGIVVIRILLYKYQYLGNENFKLFMVFAKLNIIANVAQAFIYLFTISFLYEKGIFIKVLEPLAYAGRMSLTNYIMQSVVGFVLFNGMFFSLYGKLGLAWLAVITVVSFVSLIIGSKIWMNNFRYGPLEYLWRQLTYKASLNIFKNNSNQNTK